MSLNLNHNQRPRMLSSVRFRLTVWNVGVMALVLCALGIILRLTLQVALTSSVDHDLTGFSRNIQNRVDRNSSLNDALPTRLRARLTRPIDPNDANAVMDGKLRPRFLDTNGVPLMPILPQRAIDPKGFERAVHGMRAFNTIHIGNSPVRVLSRPITKGGKQIGVIQLSSRMDDTYQQINSVTRVLLTLIPVAILVAGLAGAFLTGRALQPVRDITSAASKIEAENLSDRLDITGHDEFALLAATFNGMLDRLENAFRHLEQLYQQQRRFTGDASHELRTPLTIIKANASLALASKRSPDDYVQTLKVIDSAADRTNRIIQDLLLLARSDGGQLEVNLKTVAVTDVIDQACAQISHAGQAGEAEIIRERTDPELRVLGNADMLTRLLDNLLGNALRHTPPTGTIRIGAEAWESNGDEVKIVIADTGEGIPADHLPHLTERFYRVDAARSRNQGGTGLGLAISKSIVEAHGGRLIIESTVGVGTAVSVFLPRLRSVKNGDSANGNGHSTSDTAVAIDSGPADAH